MADTVSTISRIYDLRTLGVDRVVSEINLIIARLEQVAQVKRTISAIQFNVGGNPEVLNQVNSQLETLIGIQQQALTQLNELNAATVKGTQAQTEYAAVQKTVTMNMQESTAALVENLSVASAGMSKMQAVIYDSVASNETYNASILRLGGRMGQLKEDALFVGERIKELTERFGENKVSVMEYQEKLAELTALQMQYKTELNEVAAAMTSLNKLNNPALAPEYAQQIAQTNADLKEQREILNSNTTQGVSKQVEDARLEYEKMNISISALEKQMLIYIDTGKEASAEYGILKNRVVELTDAKKKLKNEITQLTGLTAEEKVAISEQNIELKQQAKLALAAEGSIDQLAITLGLLRDQYRGLAGAEREAAGGQLMLSNIQKLDLKVKDLDKSMGNNQRNVGNYGSAFEQVGAKLEQFVVRDLFRATAGLIVFSALFEGAQYLWDETANKENKMAESADKARQANESLAQSFNDLAQAIEKFYQDERLLIDANELLGTDQTFEKSLEGVKKAADAIKAKGVINGEVYTSEKEMLEANQKIREKEIDQLQKQQQGIKNIQDIIAEAKNKSSGIREDDKTNIKGLSWATGGMSAAEKQAEIIKSIIGESAIPADLRDKIKADIDKAVADKTNLQNVLTDLEKKYALDSTNISLQIEAKKREIADSETEFTSKQNALIYSKNIELNNQLIQLKEQSRQINEKEDIASVDKIVKDVTAKYTLMIGALKRQMAELAKQFPGDKLPEALQQKYNAIISSLQAQHLQDEKNQKYEFTNQEYAKYGQTNAILASGSSNLSTASAGYGFPSYDKMVEALEKETEAKKTALENQFKNEAAAITDSNQLIALQQQKDSQMEQVDKESYKKRLGLASEYFQRLAKNTDDASNLLIEQIDIITQTKIAKILNRGGSDQRKQRRIERASDLGTINKSNETISQSLSDLPDANEAVARTKAALDAARSSGNKDAILLSEHAYNEALKVQLDLLNKISNAEVQKAQAQQDLIKEQKIAMKALKEGAFQVAETLANSYMELLAKQDAYAQQVRERSLAWNERMQESEAQSKNQQLAQQKANHLAEQQIAKEKSQADRKRAEEAIIVNYVIASSKNLAENGANIPLALADESILTAQMTIQEAMLARAPAYRYGKDPDTHLAWLGDGNEHELIRLGNTFSVSPNKPTLMNIHNDAHVTPFSKINTTYPGTLGTQLQAPNFGSHSFAGNSTSTSSGNGQDFSDVRDATMNLHNSIIATNNKMNNIQVSLDTHKTGRAINSNFFKQVKL